ncbi:hypothetical protein Tco_1226604 [Tanacetum coccineum]
MTPATTPLLRFRWGNNPGYGIATLHSSTVVPTECRMVAKAPAKLHTNEPTVEEGIKVAIHPENNQDIYAWRATTDTRVLRSIVEHRLNVYEGCPPIRQKKRGQAPDRNKAIQEEVTKLVEAQIMREPHRTRNPQRNQRNFPNPEEDKHETKSQEVYLRCRRKDVPRPYRQHERNQGMPKKSKAVNKADIPQGLLKEVQSLNGKLACLNRGGKGVPINKAIHHRTANANSTKTIRRTDNVPLRSQGNEHAEFDESNANVLERFYTSAGNPVKEILLKLNLPDHRILKDGGEVKEFQRSFRHSDTERLSRSDEVLKLKNFKKDATLKLSKSTNQEWYEHVGPEVTRSQDGETRLCLVDDLTVLKITSPLTNSDHAGCLDIRKSTSGGIQFIEGDKLINWSSKKQDYTSMSTVEAEYATIAISCTPVQHSRTKYIDVRYHFIKEHVEKGIVELFFVSTEYELADLFSKALSQDRFQYLIRRLGMRCLTQEELEGLKQWYREYDLAHLKRVLRFSILKSEVLRVRHSMLDTTYWGFLRVETTLDIFQNSHTLYLEYDVLSLSGYGVLKISFVVNGECRHGYAISSLMDTAYWSSE